jgi:hypothetical protein
LRAEAGVSTTEYEWSRATAAQPEQVFGKATNVGRLDA